MDRLLDELVALERSAAGRRVLNVHLRAKCYLFERRS